MKKETDKVIIGNYGGFWGDDPEALKRQVQGGSLDYLTADYLAEITMSILQKQKSRNAAKGLKGGFISDFIDQLVEVAPEIKSKGIKVITNAGGIDPTACAIELKKKLDEIGIKFQIGIVEGDDILELVRGEKIHEGQYENLETGESFQSINQQIESANVYLGAAPIVELLKWGAEIIIAGRVTDTSLVMSPAIYEHNWSFKDWDKLANSLVAGHIIECGAQATGGNHTDWKGIAKWEDFGFPIVEVHSDGSFIVTKHKNTGGIVSSDSVKEQILYEMGDPKRYIGPDVIVDFTTINIEDLGDDRVLVMGATGYPPTPTYKVSMAYQNGYTASGGIIISDPDSIEKAELLKEVFWKRLGVEFNKKHASFIGYNSCHKNLVKDENSNEILLQFSVYDHDYNKVSKFSKSLASLILTGPAGLAVISGRPKISSVVSYWPCLIDKDKVKVKASLLDQAFQKEWVPQMEYELSSGSYSEEDQQDEGRFEPWSFDGGESVRVMDLCLARSGDKGDTANIGVIARNEEIYNFIRIYFTGAFIKHVFQDFCKGKVVRYELSNLMALNFLLEKSLDGGGTQSLMVDAQGKTFASALLNYEVQIPDGLNWNRIN